ncbi:porin [Halomonas pacifica]|uniref:porin n=1 Tax=Bisbaumannia pacifica TaxID=77098 RepID=UPI00235A438A|nr:porin [Halomonas pacifica]MDC8802964.1 porin [Halomonas pacifica]
MRKLLFALPFISGYACADIQVSGILDIAYEVAESGGETTERVTGAGLSANRVQFRLQESLTEDLSFLGVYEAMYRPHSDDDIGQREAFAQLISQKYGTISIGRQDTPSASAYGYADPLFGNEYSLVNNIGVFYAPWREDRSLMYISPRIEGFQFRGMATQGERDGSRNGRVYSLSLDYWSDSPWYFSIAFDRKYQRNLWDSDTMEQSTDIYLTSVYAMGNTEFTAILHRYSGYYAYAPWVDFDSSGNDLQLGIRHDFGNRHNLAVSLIHKDDDNNRELSDATGINLGYIYNYSENIDLYGVYGYVHHSTDSEVRYPLSWNLDSPLPDENPQGVQLGFRLKF